MSEDKSVSREWQKKNEAFQDGYQQGRYYEANSLEETTIRPLREANKSLTEENERLKEGLREVDRCVSKSLEIANEQDPDDMKWNCIQGYVSAGNRAIKSLLNPISQNKNTKE